MRKKQSWSDFWFLTVRSKTILIECEILNLINTDLLIRKANIEDAAAVMALIRRAMTVYARNSGISSKLESLEESLEDITASIRNHYVMIAENRDGIVGTVRLILPASDEFPDSCQDLEPSETAWFSRFAVMPELQAAGAGRLLYQAAESYLEDKGIKNVLLYTALSNQRLVDFYQSRDFKLLSSENNRGYTRGLFFKVLQPIDT